VLQLQLIAKYQKYLFLLGFILFSLFAYYPSRNYGIVTDFLSWLYRYKAGSYADVLHCFDYPGLHQFFHFINYSVFKIVGVSHLGWYFVLALMHGVNGYLLFSLNTKFLNTYSLKAKSKFLPLVIAILFLIYPFNLEAVIWKACLHYLLITAMILIMFHYLINYTRDQTKKSIILIHILFILCLFTLELSFAIPIMTIGFFLFDHYSAQESPSWITKAKQIILPQFIIFAGYILLTKVAIGDYIGHYGAENHLVFTPELILGNSWRYFFKNIFFVHFFPFDKKECKSYCYCCISLSHEEMEKHQ